MADLVPENQGAEKFDPAPMVEQLNGCRVAIANVGGLWLNHRAELIRLRTPTQLLECPSAFNTDLEKANTFLIDGKAVDARTFVVASHTKIGSLQFTLTEVASKPDADELLVEQAQAVLEDLKKAATVLSSVASKLRQLSGTLKRAGNFKNNVLPKRAKMAGAESIEENREHVSDQSLVQNDAVSNKNPINVTAKETPDGGTAPSLKPVVFEPQKTDQQKTTKESDQSTEPQLSKIQSIDVNVLAVEGNDGDKNKDEQPDENGERSSAKPEAPSDITNASELVKSLDENQLGNKGQQLKIVETPPADPNSLHHVSAAPEIKNASIQNEIGKKKQPETVEILSGEPIIPSAVLVASEVEKPLNFLEKKVQHDETVGTPYVFPIASSDVLNAPEVEESNENGLQKNVQELLQPNDNVKIISNDIRSDETNSENDQHMSDGFEGQHQSVTSASDALLDVQDEIDAELGDNVEKMEVDTIDPLSNLQENGGAERKKDHENQEIHGKSLESSVPKERVVDDVITDDVCEEGKEPKQVDNQGLNLNLPVTETLSLKQPHHQETKDTDKTPDKKTEEDNLNADTPEINEREENGKSEADDTPPSSADIKSVDPTDREQMNDQLPKSKEQEDPVQIETCSDDDKRVNNQPNSFGKLNDIRNLNIAAPNTETSYSKPISSVTDQLTDESGIFPDDKGKMGKLTILETPETTKKDEAVEIVKGVVSPTKLRFENLLNDSSDSDGKDDVRSNSGKHGNHDQSNDFQFDDYDQIDNSSDNVERFDDVDPENDHLKNFAGFDAAGSSPTSADDSFSFEHNGRNPRLDDDENDATHDPDDEDGVFEDSSEHGGRVSPVEYDSDDDRRQNVNLSGNEEELPGNESEGEKPQVVKTDKNRRETQTASGSRKKKGKKDKKTKIAETREKAKFKNLEKFYKGKFNTEEREEINKICLKWYAKGWLLSHFRTLNDGERKQLGKGEVFFEEMMKTVEEAGCRSYSVSKTADEQQSRRSNDYSKIEERIKHMVLPEAEKPPRGKPAKSRTPPPFVRYASKVYLPAGSSGQDILAAVMNGRNLNKDGVYASRKKDTILIMQTSTKDEQAVLCGVIAPQGDGFLLCVPIIDYEEYTNDEELEKDVSRYSFCAIRNIGLDKKLYDIETLNEQIPNDRKFDIKLQLSQSSYSNFLVKHYCKELPEFPTQLYRYDVERQMPFVDFYTNYVLLKNETKKTFNKIVENVGNEDLCKHIMEEFEQTLLQNSIRLNEKSANENIVSAFLTNLDLDDKERFAKQLENIEKNVPKFLQHSYGLLNFANAIIPGLNMPQIYIKPPGARTGPHVENNGLGSVNINFGPHDCVWFCVPFEFADQYEAFIIRQSKAENGRSWEKNAHYMTQYWPNESELLAAGIPLMKYVQKPGEMVYVNYGVYHWVQSNGYCTNLAWNIAHPTFLQLATAGIINDQYVAMEKEVLVPIEHIVWNMIRKEEKVDRELFDLVKAYAMRSLAHAEMERLHLSEDRQLRIEQAGPEQFQPVERCGWCPRNLRRITFNYIVYVESPTESYYCCRTCSKGVKKEYCTVYEITPIEELKDLYDHYTFERVSKNHQ